MKTLTPHLQRVANLIADGHSNAEIARELGTTVNTIKTQALKVYAAYGVRGRTQLAALLRGGGDTTAAKVAQLTTLVREAENLGVASIPVRDLRQILAAA